MKSSLLWLLFFTTLLCSEPSVEHSVLTPLEYQRSSEQTYLTYPEWFLVFNPQEYAEFLEKKPSYDFPYFESLGEFWDGYYIMYNATKDKYDFNFGYHTMVLVIGLSTTVEYSVKYIYGNTLGRLFALTQTHGRTQEDEFGYKTAKEYVEFIKHTPWYEFNFFDKLIDLWKEISLIGKDNLKKYERKCALSIEYLIKGIYGNIIKVLTKLTYEEPSLETSIIINKIPDKNKKLIKLKIVKKIDENNFLITVPRYDKFKDYAMELALQNIDIKEIAANKGKILVSCIIPKKRDVNLINKNILLKQNILTDNNLNRVVFELKVVELKDFLLYAHQHDFKLEHIYDY